MAVAREEYVFVLFCFVFVFLFIFVSCEPFSQLFNQLGTRFTETPVPKLIYPTLSLTSWKPQRTQINWRVAIIYALYQNESILVQVQRVDKTAFIIFCIFDHLNI